MTVLDIRLSSVLSRSDVDDTMRLSQIICQKCEWEVLKFWMGKIQGEALRNQLADYHLKRQKHCTNDSLVSCLDQEKKKLALPKPLKPIRRTLIPKKTTEKVWNIKQINQINFICMFVKISTNQHPRVRSWPCCLRESEIRRFTTCSLFCRENF